jgi:hypothetical protein
VEAVGAVGAGAINLAVGGQLAGEEGGGEGRLEAVVLAEQHLGGGDVRGLQLAISSKKM